MSVERESIVYQRYLFIEFDRAQDGGGLMDKHYGSKIQCRLKYDLGWENDNAVRYREKDRRMVSPFLYKSLKDIWGSEHRVKSNSICDDINLANL